MATIQAAQEARHGRQLKARAIRRALADITPSNSMPQRQSSFFSKLPAEVRFLVFQLLLCHNHDHDKSVDINSAKPLYRPGHSFRTKIHTAILLTCRLVYYEAQAIPIRSATHHFWDMASASWDYMGDLWLHHITKQRGADVYHLHDKIVILKRRQFTKFFLPHLYWKKVTWTICTQDRVPFLALFPNPDTHHIAEILAGIVFPVSCQEVNLELEYMEKERRFCEVLQQQAELCEKIGLTVVEDAKGQTNIVQRAGLKRSDGSVLCFDSLCSKRYTWFGNLYGESKDVKYRTIRLCWRGMVPRRDYMSYDQIDCLDLSSLGEYEGIEVDSPDIRSA